MNELISRQAAIDVLRTCYDTEDVTDTNGNEYISYDRALDLIEALPSAQPGVDEWCSDCKEYDTERKCCPRWNRVIRETVKDVQPRKKGKWIHKNVGGWHCSECGVQAPVWCFATTQNLSDYCPNCGVRMSKLLRVGG